MKAISSAKSACSAGYYPNGGFSWLDSLLLTLAFSAMLIQATYDWVWYILAVILSLLLFTSLLGWCSCAYGWRGLFSVEGATSVSVVYFGARLSSYFVGIGDSVLSTIGLLYAALGAIGGYLLLFRSSSLSGVWRNSLPFGCFVCGALVMFTGVVFDARSSVRVSNVDYGMYGISVIVGVDEFDQEQVLIDGPVRFVEGQMQGGHNQPGGVLVVGVREGWNNGVHYEYGTIILRDSRNQLVVAPAGTILSLPDRQEILGFTIGPGDFVVPPDSKIPVANELFAEP